MRFPFSWLQELTQTSLTPRQVAEKLTMLGLEVESIESFAPHFSGVIVGKVLEVEPIEGMDHLKRCVVSIGARTLQVVCGAPNVAAGQLVPVATAGAKLPSGIEICEMRLRGVRSEGMICSAAELGLSDDHSGILELSDRYQVGQPFAPPDTHETVIELAITPNRPDCLGMWGIARELLVSEGRRFTPDAPVFEFPQAGELYPIEIESPEDCPRYTGVILRGARLSKSPEWMRRRLQIAGMRAINNVVDVTNYVMLLTGQPLHAFDLDQLQHGKIVVRNARAKESFTTLDGKTYRLTDQNLLICDGPSPVALAGVMGGENSEVTAQTRNLLLESAHFSPHSIRKTVRHLGIVTEASKRFERGVDPNVCGVASRLATALLVELTGAKVSSPLLDAYPKRMHPVEIAFRPARANLVIGTDIDQEISKAILSNLGCHVEDDITPWKVHVPTYRPDLTREIDLIEEVARVYGYDQIQPSIKEPVALLSTTNPHVRFIDRLRQLAVRLGLDEVVTLSMVGESLAGSFLSGGEATVKLLNPLSEELAALRPSLLASMLPALAHNLNRKQKNLRFFEIGNTFSRKNGDEKIHETTSIGVVLCGHRDPETWGIKAIEADFFDLKGILETLLAQIGLTSCTFQAGRESGIYTQGAEVYAPGGRRLGNLGKLQRNLLERFDIDRPVFGFELDVNELFAITGASPGTQFRPFSAFPSVERDLAFVVDTSVEAAKLAAVIQKAAGELLCQVSLFDVYQGEQVGPGKKSLAFSLQFQSMERTLKDSEVDRIIERIIQAAKTECHATLR